MERPLVVGERAGDGALFVEGAAGASLRQFRPNRAWRGRWTAARGSGRDRCVSRVERHADYVTRLAACPPRPARRGSRVGGARGRIRCTCGTSRRCARPAAGRRPPRRRRVGSRHGRTDRLGVRARHGRDGDDDRVRVLRGDGSGVGRAGFLRAGEDFAGTRETRDARRWIPREECASRGRATGRSVCGTSASGGACRPWATSTAAASGCGASRWTRAGTPAYSGEAPDGSRPTPRTPRGDETAPLFQEPAG